MDAVDLAFAGAAEQARLIREGEVSAKEVVAATLARIDALDPIVNAYRVAFAERALEEAERPRPGPLAGVPVAVKDDFDVAGETTAWGTAAHGPPASEDSGTVARLRAAGAILIGKTHVPEMTLWPWTASTTWGPTRNPWDTARTPGGSSGGSAVAAATGMCGVALGSDGGGSVRYPSALTGLFGLKPQRDRMPSPHPDAWNGLTVAGPLARHVRDAALFLGLEPALDEPVGRLRIAVSRKAPPGSMVRLGAEQEAALDRTAELLRELGHEVVDREIDYGLAPLNNATVRYVSGLAHDVGTLPHPERLEPATRRLAAIGRRIPARSVARARAAEAGIAARINAVFETADVVLTPMAPGPPPFIRSVAGHGLVRSFLKANASAWAVPWNVIGQPAASVPAGFDAAGLPLAVQLCGRPDDEPTLLRLAFQLEQARPWADTVPPLSRPPG